MTDRRGFIKMGSAFAGMSAGGFGLRAGTLSAEAKPLLRFGIVSDVHVRLAADGHSLAPGYGTEMFERALEYFRDCGADAVVIAGDMADTGLLGELKAIAGTWFKVFPDDRAPDGRKVERIFVFGNHDAYGLKYGAEIFKDEAKLRREAIEADPARAWDECFHEEWRPFFRKTVKGFDFFGSHWTAGLWCNGYAETACSGCVEAFSREMGKCDSLRPFFYVQHPHPRDTVYGKGAWGVDDGSATMLLRAFPQAVAFSGHSHEPLSNDQSLWCGDYTSVATGSLRNVSASSLWNRVRTAGYENGICNYYLHGVERKDRTAYISKYDAPKLMSVEAFREDVQSGLIASVYPGRIEFARRDFASGLPLGEDWTVELPAKPRPFAARAKAARRAEFPSGAALSAVFGRAVTRGMERHGFRIAPEETDALLLEFPAATEGGVPAEYEITAAGAGGETYSTRICAAGGLYPRRHPNYSRTVKAAVPAAMLPAQASTVCVTPLDAFGNRGRSLTAAVRPAV